ncbi:MAG: hypothetical protein LBD17_03815 [Endomicrobium sp.]|jgi:hypothetical protein|nr:hypothetical protein [Endomicrobium sp.]
MNKKYFVGFCILMLVLCFSSFATAQPRNHYKKPRKLARYVLINENGIVTIARMTDQGNINLIQEAANFPMPDSPAEHTDGTDPTDRNNLELIHMPDFPVKDTVRYRLEQNPTQDFSIPSLLN